ncbi:MAG: hypothetical protein M1830_005136 [Pleopsidium flavum]|nr:MAG: hypothetical protein M1830_005136 [Pleopsidium flavum]
MPSQDSSNLKASEMAPELWMSVFRFLSQSDLASCMRVCSKVNMQRHGRSLGRHANSKYRHQWYLIADNPLLWQGLDLTLLEKSCYLPPDHEPSQTLIGRIEKARSITAIPRLGKKYVCRAWSFGEDLAYILNKRHHYGPLPNIRSFTIRSVDWAEGLLACLPNLIHLDISRIFIKLSDLTILMVNLGSSLKSLTLDGLKLCRSILPLILRFQGLEYLSLSMCEIPPDALEWFLTGLPTSPECDHQRIAGKLICENAGPALQESAGVRMPCLKELDLKYLESLQTSWLRRFHVVRLDCLHADPYLLNSEDPGSTDLSSSRRGIHIDVRGCRNLSLADLQLMESTWIGTSFTPSVKPFGTAGNTKHATATALPEEALPIALRVHY